MEPAKDYMENFGMIVPKGFAAAIRGCVIVGIIGKEYDDFNEWFEKQMYRQLSIEGVKVDMWMRYNDMAIDSIGYSMQKLFDNWKENPPSDEPFTFTTHTYKK